MTCQGVTATGSEDTPMVTPGFGRTIQTLTTHMTMASVLEVVTVFIRVIVTMEEVGMIDLAAVPTIITFVR